MHEVRAWWRRLTRTLLRSRLDRDIEREIAFHLAEREDELRASGLEADDARRMARRLFGNPTVQGERMREARVSMWLDTCLRNALYAVRTSRRSPGFTFTVLLTLAAGIGANAAVFSVIDAVVLRPLPVPGGDRLVRVMELLRAQTDSETQIAPVRLEEWASRTTTLEALSGYFVEDVSDTSGDLPERMRRAVVAPRFFDVWGVAPEVGHAPADGDRNSVVVSQRYWRDRLRGDPHVVGRTIRVDGEPLVISGVMPGTFAYPDARVDVWSPYPADGAAMRATPANRKERWYTGVGRLAPGVSPAQALSDLTVVQRDLARQHPDPDAAIAITLSPYKESLIGRSTAALWLLYGSVTLLLLIVCSNVTALWLARTTRRRHEIALRQALGASRAGVIGELLAETAVVSSAGGALGLFVAVAGTAAIRALMPDLPRQHELGVNLHTVVYVVLITLVVTITGLLPALRGWGGASSAHQRVQVGGSHRIHWLLVGVQVATSVVLLLGAGGLVRSVHALNRVDPGFEASGVLALRLSGRWNEAADPRAVAARIDRTLEQLAGVPGVQATASAWSLPGVARRYQAEFGLAEGRRASEPPLLAEWRTVSPGYFGVLRIPLAGGELCRLPVNGRPASEVMVNRSFAERYFRHRSILGSHLTWESGSMRGRVVGIVDDAREIALDVAAAPTVYACDCAPTPFPWLLVRTDNDPALVAGGVRRALAELEPQRSVFDMAPLEEQLAGAYAPARVRTQVVTLFAATALALACIGIYGTLSYIVGLRRREIGLRLALGAVRGVVVREMARDALRTVAAGITAGLTAAWILQGWLSGRVHGITAWDPNVLVMVIASVLVLGGLAAMVPAIRSTRDDPMRVLREE